MDYVTMYCPPHKRIGLLLNCPLPPPQIKIGSWRRHCLQFCFLVHKIVKVTVQQNVLAKQVIGQCTRLKMCYLCAST